MSILHEWARRIPNSTVSGRQVLFAPPWHSSRDRSASAKPSVNAPGGVVFMSFSGDDWRDLRDYAGPLIGLPLFDARRPDRAAQRKRLPVHSQAVESTNADIAALLWRLSVPLAGTLGEHYDRKVRGIRCAAPPTRRFLPARGKHPAAIVTAFGVPAEPEPEAISVGDMVVRAVHLTRLNPDGTKLGKIMLGSPSGLPLVVAPWTETGRGLVIAEGIEDALRGYEATGLGAWAGGSAPHMAKLAPAVPRHVESVLILEDDNEAGRRATVALADALAQRGVEVVVRGGAHA